MTVAKIQKIKCRNVFCFRLRRPPLVARWSWWRSTTTPWPSSPAGQATLSRAAPSSAVWTARNGTGPARSVQRLFVTHLGPPQPPAGSPRASTASPTSCWPPCWPLCSSDAPRPSGLLLASKECLDCSLRARTCSVVIIYQGNCSIGT